MHIGESETFEFAPVDLPEVEIPVEPVEAPAEPEAEPVPA